MLKFILKFTLLIAFAFTSVSHCFAGEISCSSIESGYNQNPIDCADANDVQDTHHCVCSLSCNNLFISISSVVTPTAYLIKLIKLTDYSLSLYPQIYLSLDKPPTV
jgi:hypothetical protein